MRNYLRGTTLAALLLSASASAQAENNEYVHAGDLSQGFAGDLTAGVIEEPVPAEEFVGEAQVPVSDFSPVAVDDLQPVNFLGGGSHHSLGICDSCNSPSCDGSGCGGCSSRSGGVLGNLLNLSHKDGWIRAEAMLMFMSERNAPPLVTTAPAGQFPVLPNATVAFGNQLDGGLSGGFRGDIGRYLTDSFGIGGRVLWVGKNGGNYSASGDQNDPNALSLGRPYYFTPTINPGTAQEDSVIISQQNLYTGSVQAEYKTNFVMADAYARMTVCKNRASRLEFITGYTYAGLDDMISIRSTRTDTNSGTNPTLAGFNFNSTFDTENRFNGGQLGFNSIISRGRWTARALTKVHLGNMHQTVTKLGQTQDLLGGNVVSTQNSSILVDEQQGTQSRDVFTFIPEMDFTVGYRFRNHVSFTAGYTFLYFDNVAMAGNQIDRYRDTSNLGANVTPAPFTIVDGSHWVQGISLGASLDY